MCLLGGSLDETCMAFAKYLQLPQPRAVSPVCGSPSSPADETVYFFTRHFLLIRPLVLVLINQLVLNLIKT